MLTSSSSEFLINDHDHGDNENDDKKVLNNGKHLLSNGNDKIDLNLSSKLNLILINDQNRNVNDDGSGYNYENSYQKMNSNGSYNRDNDNDLDTDFRAMKLQKKLSPIEKIRLMLKERTRFYVTIMLSVVSMTAGSSLLFLMPLYVDPAISTLVGRFIQNPVLCTTVLKEEHIGLLNCTWSSCREGCTSDMYQCVHIYVSYTYAYTYTHKFNQSHLNPKPKLKSNLNSDLNSLSNNVEEKALFLVNMNGCGYPPNIRCKNFTNFYGVKGAQFPCYYSRQNRTIVLSHYDRDEQIAIILKYFVIPFIITCATSIALCIMHCDCSISYRHNIQQTY